jgi:hypothetical protein
MGIAYNTSIVSDGLVFALDAANSRCYSGSGLTANVLVGSKTGALTNGVGFTNSNNGSFTFDGTNDFIDLSTNLDTGNNFSVFAWIYPTNINIRNHIIGNSFTYTGSNGWSMATATNYSGTSNNFYLAIGADVALQSAYNESIIRNAWNYIGGTVLNGGENIILYVAGTAVTSNFAEILATNTITYNTQDMAIGRRVSTNPEYFIGKIAQVNIYNRVLTAQEIKQNYNATKKRYGL